MNSYSFMFPYFAVDDNGVPLVAIPCEINDCNSLKYEVIEADHKESKNFDKFAGHLIIRNPFILSPNDPYIDLEVFSEKFGHEKACEIALSCQYDIEKTENWKMISSNYLVDSLKDLLRLDSRHVDLLYIDFQTILKNNSTQSMLMESGFDGLIYQSFDKTKKVVIGAVFNEYQFVEIKDSNKSLKENNLVQLKVDEIKRRILQNARSGGISIDSKFIQSVHRQMLPVDIFELISEKDPLIANLGKQSDWQKIDYVKFSNNVLNELNKWLDNGGLKNNQYVLHNIKDRNQVNPKTILIEEFSSEY